MNSKENKALQFYQNLGKLFYAIAAADNNVKEEEVVAINKCVKKYWLSQERETTNSKNESKNAILETFNWLCKDNEYNAEACYNSFLSFKRQNESIFTTDINSLILKTVGEISASFSGQNKSELIFLAKLSIELKKY